MTARARGTLIVREGRVVYASDGLRVLAGRSPAEILGRPSADLLVAEDGARMAELRERRRRGEEIPHTLELELLLPDGSRRPVEAYLEHDGPEDILHLRDLGTEAARRQLLAGLAALGATLRAEVSDRGVHARLRAELGRLGAVAALLQPAGERSTIAWVAAPDALREEFVRRAGQAPEGASGVASTFARQVVAEGCAFTDDWASHVAGFVPPALASGARSVVNRAGLGQAIGVRIDGGALEGTYLVVASPLLRSDDLPAFRLFGAQVSAALDAARTIGDLSRRNAHLAVLARVAALAGDASDLPAFFREASDVLRPVAGYVGGAIYVPDPAAGDLVRVHLDEGAPEIIEERTRRAAMDGPLGAALRARTASVVPLPYPGGRPELMAALPFRAIAWVPLVARSRGVGVLVAAFEQDLEVARGSLELLSSVGAHFASAIESHALLRDLRRRVGELEAVHALTLRVFANRPGDVDALFRDACGELARTLSARSAAVYLTSDGGATIRLAAEVGMPPEVRAATTGVRPDALAREIMTGRAPLQTGDVTREPRSVLAGAPGVPPMSVLGAPLASRQDVRGLVLVADRPGRTFDADEVAVATALATALGLGLENAELWAEAHRRVEDLSLVADAGREIARSLDLGDVLRTASDAARRLVGSSRAWVLLHDPETGALRVAGGAGIEPHVEGTVVEILPGSFLETLLDTRRPAAAEDVGPSAVGGQYRSLLGGRALAAVPVLLRGSLLGVLVTDEVVGPRRFTEADLGRLGAIADRLAVAIENARLYRETRDRAEQLGLLHEVGRSLVESLDVEQVLERGVRSLARIVAADDAYLWLTDPAGETLTLRALTRHRDRLLGRVVPVRPVEDNLAARVLASREPLVVRDAESDPRIRKDLNAIARGRAYLVLPLVVRDRAIGAAVIVDTRAPRLFTPPEVERAAAVGNQLAVAVEHARLYEDLRRSYAELESAQRQLVQGERLAALGELSAIVAHEVRNPLGVIFNSLGTLRRLVRPAGDAGMLFDIVEEEAERLNRIVGDLLDFARPSTPELRPDALARVAEDAVAAAIAQQAGRIELVREHDPALPDAPIDARLVRQALVNVAANAVQAMPRGGRLTVRTRRDGDAAVVELEDTGAGIPDEVRARIFEPFFTTKASGTGLGLAVVRRIVEGHGGAVSVRSAPGAGTTFLLRFPLARPDAR